MKFDIVRFSSALACGVSGALFTAYYTVKPLPVIISAVVWFVLSWLFINYLNHENI